MNGSGTAHNAGYGRVGVTSLVLGCWFDPHVVRVRRPLGCCPGEILPEEQ